MLPHYLVKTSMSAKQAINDELRGSIAIQLSCGGVVSHQIKEGLLLKKIKIGKYLTKL